MPEQRNLRTDLVWARDTKTIMENPESQRFPPFIRSQAVKLAVLAIPALERAIVAEEAVKRLVTVLNVHTNLCVFCPSGEIIAPPEYDSAGYRAWACKRNQPRDPEHLEECFADAMLTEAHAKAGL